MFRTEKRLMALSLGIAFAVDTHLQSQAMIQSNRRWGAQKG